MLIMVISFFFTFQKVLSFFEAVILMTKRQKQLSADTLLSCLLACNVIDFGGGGLKKQPQSSAFF